MGREISWLFLFLFWHHENVAAQVRCDISKVAQFGVKLQNAYYDNPYHNQQHGFDVALTTHKFCTQGGLRQIAKLSPQQYFATIIAACAHDTGHPGINNQFLIQTGAKLAIIYNDSSPLENFHCSQTFTLLSDEKCNFLENFSDSEYREFRKWVIQIILSTDMSVHFSKLAELNNKLQNSLEVDTDNDKLFFTSQIVHAADISTARPFSVQKKWSELVLVEFFEQGDKERALGLPISNLCDRFTVLLPQSQISFSDFIVLPTFKAIEKLLPNMQKFTQMIQNNRDQWLSLAEEAKRTLENHNKETVIQTKA